MKTNRHSGVVLLSSVILLVAITSCATRIKMQYLANSEATSSLGLPKEKDYQAPEVSNVVKKDTIRIVDFDGQEVFMMKTMVDEEGESVEGGILNAAVVSARFRNLAERDGRIELEFQVTVPKSFQESKWQIRYQPTLYMMDDTLKLGHLLVTGKGYQDRKEEEDARYERFNKRIETISRDKQNARFQRFMDRYSPDGYVLDSDTLMIKDDGSNKSLDLAEGELQDHYYNFWSNNRYKNMEARRGYEYSKTYGEVSNVALDTLIETPQGSYIYKYVYTMKPDPKLRKVDVTLDGEMLGLNHIIYRMPTTEPLTFYISSIAAFVDNTEKYKTVVIERKVAANASYNIVFNTGKYDVNPSLGNNSVILDNIKKQLLTLIDNKTFDLDSVVITSSCSPEGTFAANQTLGQHRSNSIAQYFNGYMSDVVDSINAEVSFHINAQGRMVRDRNNRVSPVRFSSNTAGENWPLLSRLIEKDEQLDTLDKEEYATIASNNSNPDQREAEMKRTVWYNYVFDNLYPQLRSVQFDFNLHRKGMVKDTVHTTVLDTAYMDAVQLIRDREFEKAVEILAPYEDFNSAVAFLAVNQNAAARQILERQPQTAQVRYMLAIIYARYGEEEKAVQYFSDACHMDSMYISRGNLDPEISTLIRKYNINFLQEKDDDEPDNQ